MENYRILKLKNGDSVIAGLGTITEKNTIILERPMQFKTMTVMDDKNMGVRDYLLVRNWAEYSTDKNVEIQKEDILAILTPDEKLMMVYDLEKKKEDDPQILNLEETTDTDQPPHLPDMQGFQKMNIQLQLPPEASEQFLEMLGIQFEDIEDEEDNNDIEDDIDDMENDDIEDDVSFPPPPKKTKKPTTSKKQSDVGFGNSPDDWSPDPNDYLK